MKRAWVCPHDGAQCEGPWLRHMEKVMVEKGAESAARMPRGFFSECGKRPPGEGKRKRGRPAVR